MEKSSSSRPMTPALFITVAVLLLAAAAAPKAVAVTCDAKELLACLPAFEGSPTPSSECCSKLKEQQPCLCGYLKDPNLKKYWGSPKAKTIADACGVPYPPQC
ncbi:non-specific lipid-transfer protein 2-like [Punica granatum]|uniref:Bifunctional inhibitor/plant lipid transfer protein/seed storage helical domain-containing protein n=2 Tax=Punica granatum TaxID=22663 RepID=A0A218XHF1_PUNGR|nr:non-specific lipid-transfer protein 2-like [Punica granatum]OWM84645.1 hypothetical protein CDL15_Pgr027432 [Punica granatum]PKI69943.1 hypothetical protein CRG98_009818 [Punica granatum]